MFRRIFILLVISALPAFGQEPRVLSPPISDSGIRIDSDVEEPPVYSGSIYVNRPSAGQRIAFQVFLPGVGSQESFGYELEFSNSAGFFEDHFTIISAITQFSIPVLDSDGVTISSTIVKRELSGAHATGRSELFLIPRRISPNGFIATVTLEAKQNVPPTFPLRLNASVTILSVTSPARLWNMVSHYDIRWL